MNSMNETPANLQDLENFILPHVKQGFRRKPDGSVLDAQAQGHVYDTIGLLMTDYLNGQKTALAGHEKAAALHRRLVQECELGENILRRVAEHRGSLADDGASDPFAVATEYLHFVQPKKPLQDKTRLAKTGMIIFGLADAAVIGNAMRKDNLDALNQFNGTWIELLGLSVLTLLAYFGIGLLWRQKHPWARVGAVAGYIGVVTLLCSLLWDDKTARAREWWAKSHQASGADLFGMAQNAGPPCPWLVSFGYVLLWACLFSVAGLLFIYAKDQYTRCRDLWAERATPEAKLRHAADAEQAEHDRDTCATAIDNVTGNFHAIGRHLNRTGHAAATEEERANRNAMLKRANSILTPKASKTLLRKEAAEIDKWLENSALIEPGKSSGDKPSGGNSRKASATVMALLLVAGGALFSALPARAETSAQLCAAAPSFTLMIDTSTSSPAQNPAFLNNAAREIEPIIRALPPCSTVYAFTVGDGRTIPLMVKAKVFLRSVPGEGGTKDDIIRAVRQLLARMPAEIKQHPQGRSELIGAWADALRNFNPNATAPNVAVMLSDGVEVSASANCERRACTFPRPSFRLSSKDEIILLGLGLGVSQEKAASLARTWETWFAQAGITTKTFRVKRVF